MTGGWRVKCHLPSFISFKARKCLSNSYIYSHQHAESAERSELVPLPRWFLRQLEILTDLRQKKWRKASCRQRIGGHHTYERFTHVTNSINATYIGSLGYVVLVHQMGAGPFNLVHGYDKVLKGQKFKFLKLLKMPLLSVN